MLNKFFQTKYIYPAKNIFMGFINNMKISPTNINFCAQPPKANIIKAVTRPAIQDAFASSALKGTLSEHNMNLICEIRELFELAHSSIKAIAKSLNTRTTIKNGYPAIKKGVAGSKILEFKGIGTNGEDISVNQLRHGIYKKTVIGIGSRLLVINDKGQIEKNSSLNFVNKNNVRQKGEKLEFFTQKEIDNLETDSQLFALRNELQRYIEYILNRQRQITNIREKRADNIPGNLDNYKPLIDEINENYNYFKTHINKLTTNSLDKALFRMYNKIKTFVAQRSILLKDATPDGRSVFVGYTIFNKKEVMKILVMDYNNKTVDKSFILYDNKLAKYSPKKLTDRPKHTEYDFHYYTQEEIDNSELEKYMNIVLDRLEEVNDKLRQGIEEKKSKI